MQLFYTPDIECTVGSKCLLNEDESHHCIRVLRLFEGDIVHLTNGKGTVLKASILKVAQKECLLQIEERFDHWEERPYYLHLAVAPTKNPDRYEWMVEKVTEIGVDEITPLIAVQSERKVFKTTRIERIAISAMKQSYKAKLPVIQPAKSFAELINTSFDGVKLIAHCGEGVRVSLTDVLNKQLSDSHKYTILIGPEGDFSPEEVAMAEAKGFRSIHLGASRLRTETAGVIAAAGVYLFANHRTI